MAGRPHRPFAQSADSGGSVPCTPLSAPAAGSVLGRRLLNRSLLARQHLLRRARMPAAAAVEHLVGLQAQVPRDPYVGLWSRLERFDPLEVERLLLDRGAVRMTLMRGTLHLVTARDAHALRAATQDVIERAHRSSPFARRVEGMDVERLAAAAVELVEERPRTIAELGKAFAERWPEGDAEAMAYTVRYLLPLVQVPPRGLLSRSGAPKLTTLAAWLGPDTDAAPDGSAAGAPPGDATDGGPGTASEVERVDQVLLRYLRAFGPATSADIRTWSWWTGVAERLERLRPRLACYRDEAGRELFDVPGGVFAAPDEPAPVRFLGEYDNVFLSHAERSRITGELAWDGSYRGKGAFFVDGFLAGAWRRVTKPGPGRIELEPRRPLTPRARREVAAEAEALFTVVLPEAQAPRLAWLDEGEGTG